MRPARLPIALRMHRAAHRPDIKTDAPEDESLSKNSKIPPAAAITIRERSEVLSFAENAFIKAYPFLPI